MGNIRNVKTEENKLDSFQALARLLRDSTWDIVETWLEETKINSARENLYLARDPETLINELPTLVGGIAKVIDDPMHLMDLEPGGHLYDVAQRFGRLRQETGFQIEKLMADFSILRQKLWLFCENAATMRDGEFFELERRLNLSIDMITAAAVEVFAHRRSSELLELSVRDKLTGFLHAKAFLERLDGELAKSRRYRHPLIVLRVDIDDFTRFNEEEGRLTGNQLLRQVATGIHAEIRGSDEAARLHADEFGIIMPHTQIADAKHAAERIRRRVRRIKREKDRPVTVSIGGSIFPDGADDRETLMNGADVALAAARQAGGDLVKL